MQDDDTQSDGEFLVSIRQQRALLVQQIEDSRVIIEHSLELVRQMDDVLTKAERQKP